MTAHALIIAIEEYPQAANLAEALPGTLQAGLDFRNWLQLKWTAEGRTGNDTQILFCSEPKQPFGDGATLEELIECMEKIVERGAGQVDELFVYFSGHGFAFVDGGLRADVAIASNFVNAMRGASSCLNLDWMMRWLCDSLGQGRHFYFVDACRNQLDGTQVVVSPKLLPDPPGGASQATVYLLQSTLESRFAAVASQFPKALIGGLQGQGKAKVWENGITDAMQVKYDSLRRHVKAKMQPSQPITNSVSGPDGESEAVLATLRPVPMVRLEIRITNVSHGIGEVQVLRGRDRQPDVHEFDSWPQTIVLEPDTYSVAVNFRGAVIVGVNPLQMDIYDDFTHELRLAAPARTQAQVPDDDWNGEALEGFTIAEATSIDPDDVLPGAGAADVAVEVVVPPGSNFRLRNLDTGDERMLDQTQNVRLRRGRYITSLRTSNQSLVRRNDLDITSEVRKVDAGDWGDRAAMAGIAAAFPQRDGWPDISESLGGPIVDPDLDVWLALLGGGRILDGVGGGDFSKLHGLPLHDFSNEKAGASSIYLLAGLEEADGELSARVEGSESAWQLVASTAITGVRECYQPTINGPLLVSLRLGTRNTYTVATATMPNRSTLLTLSLDADKHWRVGQYMLPLGRQLALLPAEVLHGLDLETSPLHKLRFLAQAQRSFRRRRDLTKEFSGTDLQLLVNAKWLDPIGSAMACYELVRRNFINSMPHIVNNMRQYFPQLPDTAALRRLSGIAPENVPQQGMPLFQDGLRAWPGMELPYPESHLDFASPWTAWRMVVQ